MKYNNNYLFNIAILSFLILQWSSGFAEDRLFALGFDCKKAKTETEKLICNDDSLSRWDSMLQQQYKTALATRTPKERITLKNDQNSWLKIRDSACKKSSDANSCLQELYEKRYDELNLLASRQISFDKYPVKGLQQLILLKFSGLPDGYIKLSDYEYVFLNNSHGGRIDLGIYYANTKTKIMDKIVGGSPTIEGYFHNKGTSWMLIHTTDLSWGVESENYSAIVFNIDKSKPYRVENLARSECYYYEEDEKKDPCFKSERKGYDVIQDILYYDIKVGDNTYEIIFNIKQKNCTTGKWSITKETYKIKR